MRCVGQRAKRSLPFSIRSRVILSGPGAEFILEDLMVCLMCCLPKKTTVSDNFQFDFIISFIFFSISALMSELLRSLFTVFRI